MLLYLQGYLVILNYIHDTLHKKREKVIFSCAVWQIADAKHNSFCALGRMRRRKEGGEQTNKQDLELMASICL